MKRIHPVAGLLFLGWFLVTSVSTLANPLDDWQWRNPLPQGNPLNTVCYGNGIFVALGPNRTVLTSTNGQDWVPRTSSVPGGISDVLYAQGQFVAVGSFIITSTNGIDWVPRLDVSGTGLYHIAYGNGVFVATGFYDNIATSPDAVTWTPRALGICCNQFLNILGIAFGAGRFVTVGYSAAMATSTDGVTWTYLGGPPANTVEFANGRFLILGDGTRGTSFNGLSWTFPSLANPPFDLYSLAYGNGQYIAAGYERFTSVPAIASSTDGVNWTRRHSPSGWLQDITYANDVFVAAGEILLTSTNVSTWTTRMIGNRSVLRSVAAGPDGYVAVGNTTNGGIAISPNGTEWTWLNLGTNRSLARVTFDRGHYTAVGDAGEILTSTNGLTWTTRPSGTTNPLSGIAHGSDGFVAVGWHPGGQSPRGVSVGIGTVLTSADSVSWNDRSTGLWNTNCEFEAVTYANGIFLTVGGLYVDSQGYRLLAATSSDGQAWNPRIIGPGGRLHGAAHGNGSFVVVGDGGAILTSSNGVDWVSRLLPAGYLGDLTDVTWAGDMFAALLVPFIFTSNDGVTWTAHDSRSAYPLNGIAYKDGRFLTVGGGGTILQSGQTLITLTGRFPSAGNGFELTMSGGVERRHCLQVATNLTSGHWTDLLTFTNTQSTMQFLDTNALAGPGRFYRAVVIR